MIATGFWAFEEQMPYQKYQRPPILVRFIFALSVSYTKILHFVKCKIKKIQMQNH